MSLKTPSRNLPESLGTNRHARMGQVSQYSKKHHDLCSWFSSGCEKYVFKDFVGWIAPLCTAAYDSRGN